MNIVLIVNVVNEIFSSFLLSFSPLPLFYSYKISLTLFSLAKGAKGKMSTRNFFSIRIHLERWASLPHMFTSATLPNENIIDSLLAHQKVSLPINHVFFKSIHHSHQTRQTHQTHQTRKIHYTCINISLLSLLQKKKKKCLAKTNITMAMVITTTTMAMITTMLHQSLLYPHNHSTPKLI